MTELIFPSLEISGAARERGLQYGRALPGRIRRSVEIYRAALHDIGLDASRFTSLCEQYAGEIRAFGPDYLDEMQGIADGAGLTLQDILLVNARTEIVARARIEAGRSQTPEVDLDDDGCTATVVLPERGAGGRLIHAQNWDWRAECAETALVLTVRGEDGLDIMTFVEAGGLARSGMNSAGISLTANYLESERDYRGGGVPLVLIRRKALEQKHFAMAVKTVATTAKACSNNMMLATAQGFAIDFECAPDESFQIYPEDGLIVHGNHWVSPVALSKLRDAGLGSVPDSVYRDWRVRRLLQERGRTLGVDDVKYALADRFLDPYSVCRPPRLNSSGNLSATVATVIMQPEAGTMQVAALPAHGNPYTEHRL